MDNDKDASITRMLRELKAVLGADAFDVVDHWENDRCAIGIAHPSDQGVLIYISTHKDDQNDYWISLELPPKPGDDLPYIPAGERAVHGIQALAAVVRAHLDARNA